MLVFLQGPRTFSSCLLLVNGAVPGKTVSMVLDDTACNIVYQSEGENLKFIARVEMDQHGLQWLGGNPGRSKQSTNELHHEKTNVPVSNLVRHKPGCTATEDGQRLEISDFESRGILLSM